MHLSLSVSLRDLPTGSVDLVRAFAEDFEGIAELAAVSVRLPYAVTTCCYSLSAFCFVPRVPETLPADQRKPALSLMAAPPLSSLKLFTQVSVRRSQRHRIDSIPPYVTQARNCMCLRFVKHSVLD